MHNFNGLKISRRVIASSAFKYGRGYDCTENPMSWFCVKSGIMNPNDFGAIVTKTITIPEWVGYYKNRYLPWKVIRIYRDKVYNKIGWHNCGIKKFVEIELPKLGVRAKKIIVSIGALTSINEFFEMISILNDYNVAGIELNISCHNVDLNFLEDIKTLQYMLKTSRCISKHPLIVKIKAESEYITISKIAQDEKTNIIHVMNTMEADSKTLGGKCGRSGKENKEVALRIISKLRHNGITIPIIGGSWIKTIKDIQDYKKAGADIFSISSDFLYRPYRPGCLARKVK